MAKPARELPQLHSMSDARVRRRERRKDLDGTANATAAGCHLDLTYQRILQLVEENVLQKLPNGRFDLDDCRVRYIRWLRDPERRSAKSKVDQEFTKAKTELIAIRVREKKRELIETEEAVEAMEKLIATVLLAMSGMAPRIARLVDNNLGVRREVDRIVYETRVSLANQFNEFADQAGEPPLEQAPTTDDTEEVEPVS